MRVSMMLLPVLISVQAFGQSDLTDAVVARFGTGSITDIRKDYSLLAKDPVKALELLSKHLEPISEERYVMADDQTPKAPTPKPEKMIWRLRALSSLTGKTFTARTAYRFKGRGDDSVRHSILTSKTERYSQDVAFYGFRMSVGVYYFAPHDAQEKIIRAWLEWVATNSRDRLVPHSTELKW